MAGRDKLLKGDRTGNSGEAKGQPADRTDAGGLLLIALAAGLWGTLGLFFKASLAYGLTSLGLAFLRTLLTLAVLILGLALVRPRLLSVAPRHLPGFLLLGGVSVALFYWVYILAVDLTSVATGAVLLYTAPAWVTLLAHWLFGEALGRRKVGALALAFVGCALVARAYDLQQLRVNGLGILAGLTAGLTYALYSILSVPLLRLYPPLTVVTWAVAFGALLLAPVVAWQGWATLAPALTPSPLWLWLLGLTLGPTVGALTLYTAGLRRVPAGVASITATLEPVVATVLAVVVLGERLAVPQLVGAALVVTAVLLLALPPQKH